MLNLTEIRQPLPRRSLRTPKEVRLDELLNSPFITLRIDDVPVGLKLKDACRAMADRGRRDAASDMLEEVMTAFRDIDRLCDQLATLRTYGYGDMLSRFRKLLGVEVQS